MVARCAEGSPSLTRFENIGSNTPVTNSEITKSASASSTPAPPRPSAAAVAAKVIAAAIRTKPTRAPMRSANQDPAAVNRKVSPSTRPIRDGGSPRSASTACA